MGGAVCSSVDVEAGFGDVSILQQTDFVVFLIKRQQDRGTRHHKVSHRLHRVYERFRNTLKSYVVHPRE